MPTDTKEMSETSSPFQLFIMRPVATTLLMIAVLVLGLTGYAFLPVSALPAVDFPTIEVQTFYPGASPEVMTSAVTAPLEKQLGQMPNLKQMVSHSSGGASIITLQFNLDLSLDIAEQQVQAAISAANSLLPSDLPAPPVYAKVNPADTAIMTLALTSATLPLTEVHKLADTRLAAKLSQVPGVGLVTLGGGQQPAVRIRFNAKAMAARGLNIDDLRTTITTINVNTPKGTINGPMRSYAINANDQLQSPQEYCDSVIAYKSGAPVHLCDVANVVDAPENTRIAAWVNLTPAVILSVQRQPGANVIDVVDKIKALLPSLQASLPPSISVSPLTDRTTTIRASISDVEFELVLAVGLVVLVIFLFLRDVAATLIPSLSVPLSIIGTFAIMYLWGFSLDNLSLMALTIATGFVVDDAIVVVENISRHVEAGETPLRAALIGSREIGFTIISLTMSLLAVLIPLLFMGGVVGRLFHEFAITLAASIAVSAIISLTLVPMMSARLLRRQQEPTETRSPSFVTRSFSRLTSAYGRMLSVVLDHPRPALLVAFATFALTVYLFVTIPKGFFPEQDVGLIQATTDAPQGISFASMAEHQQALAGNILKDPDVISLSSFVGIDGTNATTNQGRMLIALKPREERVRDAATIIRALSTKAKDVAGIRLVMQPVQDLTVETSASASRYQLILENPDFTLLNTWVTRLVERLRHEPALTDISSDLQTSGPALNLTINRSTAARFGITPATIDNALYDAFGQRIVSTIFTESNQYRVIMEADPELMSGLDALNGIYLPSAISTSGQVPLRALVDITEVSAPLQISHLGQFPAATISYNLAPNASLGTALQVIANAEAEIGLPVSFRSVNQGSAAAFATSLNNELYLVLAAIAAVYLVLGVLYESFIHPLTILSTLPSAGVGALIALRLTGHDLDIIGVIGIVLLIGIVKKNAIMIIDFALDAERERGATPRDAIFEACLLRFRPVLMTTFAALFAALPLMFASGTGSELRQPLGIAISGGLVVCQLLTLFTTPVIYLALDKLAQRWTRPGVNELASTP